MNTAPIIALPRVGGHLALDFANTAEWQDSQCQQDWLTDYSDLVQWSHGAGLLTLEQTNQSLSQAAGRPQEAAIVLERGRALRTAIHDLGVALAAGYPPPMAAVQVFEQELTPALGHLRVVFESSAWTWHTRPEDLDAMLWPIVWEAAQLFANSNLRHRLKCCPGEACGWLFVDTSRKGNRRWCSMEDCGNRHKARRYYHRHRPGEMKSSSRTIA
ncbi:MAG: CGNR zinc finger domain-containing protein [Gloeomargaritaceae cyanobacterium C42_A2020_066]|nr:CGNR zinc finger domain-containing protein [Gloeomargaritaceae cyanobacterium C42_A2020_066]